MGGDFTRRAQNPRADGVADNDCEAEADAEQLQQPATRH